MFVPQTFSAALLMIVISTICWGSWANTFKGTRAYRFELFYWDYMAGACGSALLLALTLGSLRADGSDFLSNLRSADAGNIAAALIAGVIFNVANVLLVAAIDMAGLAIAFPVAIGIALVVGVLMSYLQQPRGSALLLAGGVICALIAVSCDGKAYQELHRQTAALSRKSMAVCVMSGLLMGLFAPFVARALSTGHALNSYSVGVLFTIGALLCCFFFNVYLMRRPLVGAPVDFAAFLAAGGRNHVLGLLGGAIWGVGTVFNFVAASLTGVAISYAIGQAAPMVAAAWGVFVWGEFRGSNARAQAYLLAMFAFFILAIALVSQAYRAAG